MPRSRAHAHKLPSSHLHRAARCLIKMDAAENYLLITWPVCAHTHTHTDACTRVSARTATRAHARREAHGNAAGMNEQGPITWPQCCRFHGDFEGDGGGMAGWEHGCQRNLLLERQQENWKKKKRRRIYHPGGKTNIPPDGPEWIFLLLSTILARSEGWVERKKSAKMQMLNSKHLGVGEMQRTVTINDLYSSIHSTFKWH